ncbi:MAG: pyruvate kinase [Chloroflexi bacterium]|nr:pyruvate kinase [Chloroflexota bacterium]
MRDEGEPDILDSASTLGPALPATRTKVVATIGPASSDLETLRAMLRAGLDVARLNFSHGELAEHALTIARLRQAAELEGRPLAILQDLQGPRLRLRRVAEAQQIELGQAFVLDARTEPGDAQGAGIAFAEVLSEQVQPGDRILIDDGRLELAVRSAGGGRIDTEVRVGGPLRSRKGLNLPDTRIDLPPLTAKDRTDLAFGLAQGVDYVALSFVGSAAHVLALRALIGELGHAVPIIAKIERRPAVEAMHAIVEAADGVMVARGDLALEIGAERVPLVQKALIREANAHARPVITATQMLESMIENPRPTRAETSDVANAILDGTDAVMLSGETAIGAYPVEAVAEMTRIAIEIEPVLDYAKLGRRGVEHGDARVTFAISGAAVQIAQEVGVAAIIAITTSGWTAQRTAHRRPGIPIIGATRKVDTFRRLALIWGVRPLLIPDYATTDDMVDAAIRSAVAAGLVQAGDLVVVTSGLPFGISGTTNMVQVRRAGA